MIKYCKLEQHFDKALLQQDVDRLPAAAWHSHYNKSHYEGEWSILPLRSVGGHAGSIVSVHSLSEGQSFEDTEWMARCPYIQTATEFFQCEKRSVRLMKLHSGSDIKEHCDQEMNFEEGEVRFHIPVITNPEVHFMLDGERLVMREGECWYLNLSIKHAVRNNGVTDRVHLVIDCKVNDWIKQLFDDHIQYQQHVSSPQKREMDAVEKLRVIEQLKLLNTPVALELAAKMENEL